MKWLHMADLHLGRRLDTFDLLPDQTDMLAQLLRIAREEKPDGALIAGDVYDRAVPSAEAVRLLDGFLTQLSEVCPVFMISGNHDSGDRLAYAQALLARQRVYICGRFDGTLRPVTLGDTDVYMLPYMHPAQAREIWQDDTARTMQDVVRMALERREKGCGKRSILLAHLFVVSGGAMPERSDSELSPVGTLDQVDASLLDGFDYVALGHIHGPQRVGRDTVRYAGSPLPYSFSEEYHRKSVTIWEPEAEAPVRQVALTPLRRMRTVRGTLEELLTPGYDVLSHDDFIAACLADPLPQLDAAARLRQTYPNLAVVTYARRHESSALRQSADDVDQSSPLDLFAQFFTMKTGEAMDEEQAQLVTSLLERAWKEESQP